MKKNLSKHEGIQIINKFIIYMKIYNIKNKLRFNLVDFLVHLLILSISL